MTKKIFRYFTVMQYREEEAFLRNQHRDGWRLKRVSGFRRYCFEACEPQDVIYKLDYNREGLSHRDEYRQLFADCGWTYVQDYLGYSYFCKPASAEPEKDDIFCDEASRLELVSRIVKGRIAPLLLLFFAVAIQLFLSIQYGRTVFSFICAAILVLYAAVFACFGVQYVKFRRSIR